MTTAQADRLKFSEFVDLVLAKLYEWDMEAPGRSFPLNRIRDQLTTRLTAEVPNVWILDAGKVLQSRGLVQAVFAFGGYAEARITGEGRLYVEEDRGFVKKYHEAPQHYFVTVSGNHNQVAIGQGQEGITQSMSIEESRKPAFEALEQIAQGLRADKTLAAEQRKELQDDLEDIKRQLHKREPNRPALAALLEPVSQVLSVATQVANLIQLLNA